MADWKSALTEALSHEPDPRADERARREHEHRYGGFMTVDEFTERYTADNDHLPEAECAAIVQSIRAEAGIGLAATEQAWMIALYSWEDGGRVPLRSAAR